MRIFCIQLQSKVNLFSRARKRPNFVLFGRGVGYCWCFAVAKSSSLSNCGTPRNIDGGYSKYVVFVATASQPARHRAGSDRSNDRCQIAVSSCSPDLMSALNHYITQTFPRTFETPPMIQRNDESLYLQMRFARAPTASCSTPSN